jgi:hypothetical protein
MFADYLLCSNFWKLIRGNGRMMSNRGEGGYFRIRIRLHLEHKERRGEREGGWNILK